MDFEETFTLDVTASDLPIRLVIWDKLEEVNSCRSWDVWGGFVGQGRGGACNRGADETEATTDEVRKRFSISFLLSYLVVAVSEQLNQRRQRPGLENRNLINRDRDTSITYNI